MGKDISYREASDVSVAREIVDMYSTLWIAFRRRSVLCLGFNPCTYQHSTSTDTIHVRRGTTLHICPVKLPNFFQEVVSGSQRTEADSCERAPETGDYSLVASSGTSLMIKLIIPIVFINKCPPVSLARPTARLLPTSDRHYAR